MTMAPYEIETTEADDDLPNPDAWHLVLADVQELPLPIPARGQVVPWKPTPDLVAQVLQQLPDFRP